MLSFSKKRFRVVGADAPVGERVTMGFTLPHGSEGAEAQGWFCWGRRGEGGAGHRARKYISKVKTSNGA